jgi:hypothetical protein
MYNYLQIEGDPTTWSLVQPIDASRLTGEKIVFQVSSPLQGTLVISPRAASVAAVDQPWHGHGGVPSDGDVLAKYIYLPTSTGPSAGSYGYQLPISANLAELADRIAAAMQEGRNYTVHLAGIQEGGVLVLSGTALPFVVLSQVTSTLGDPSGTGGVPSD